MKKKYLTSNAISKKLINLERLLRRAEKTLGIKVYPWLVKQNIKNTGNSGKNRDLSYTKRQLRFCQEYLIDLNATQAAIRAGYGRPGAATQGSLLLKQEKIQARIRELNKQRMKRLNINTDSVIKEIALIAFSNIGNVASWTPTAVTLKDSSRLTSGQMASIQSIEEKITRYGNALKVKLYDKPSALMVLCRYLNILDGEANITDPADAAKKMKEAYLAMFNSVPVEKLGPEPGQEPDEEALDEIKNGPRPDIKAIPGETVTSDPSQKAEPDVNDYLME